MLRGRLRRPVIEKQVTDEHSLIKHPDIADDDYFLKVDLTDRQLELMDNVLLDKFEGRERVRTVLNELAEIRGNPSPNITLHDPQVTPVVMSYLNKRFFIGDKPGLGKTVMSAASYGFYMLRQLLENKTPKKVIVVTVSNHVWGFQKEWESFGIKLLPLPTGTTNIRRTFANADMSEYDGLILNWDGLKTNGFLEHYLQYHSEYDYAVFDETSTLLNEKTDIYKTVFQIVNHYQKGIERVIFLNGSSFEKDIFDFYSQFNILQPRLIPSKRFLEDRYIVRNGRNQYVQDYVNQGGHQFIEMVRRTTGEIEGYRHQEELKDRLKYYYIARSKSDYSDNIPEHSFVLHPVPMTLKQRADLDENFNISKVNSPTTSDPSFKMTLANSPKLDQVVSFAHEVSSDRPIIYAYNRESQKALKTELEKLGYKVKILNGEVGSSEERSAIEVGFNNHEFDILIFNVVNAINLPSSERILFYDIPTMPQTTNQVKGRIDRNNYTQQKFYDFFCYLDSPEMINIVKLACFREYQSSKFTGQYENIYAMLVAQLSRYLGLDKMSAIEQKIDQMYDTNSNFEEITIALKRILGV